MRRTGYALRTLVGPWLAVVATGLYVGALLQRGAPWRGETMWTLEWLGIPMFVLGPLAAGAAAIDAAMIARPRAAFLVVPTRRPRMTFLRAAAWCLLPLVAVHVLVYVVAVIVGQSPVLTMLRPDMLLALLAQCLVLGGYVAFGSLVGRFTAPILAGLTAAVVGLLAFYVLSGSASGTGTFALLNLGGATVTQLGWRYSPASLVLQILILAAVGALAMSVRVHYKKGTPRPTRAGLGAIALILAVIAAGQVLGPDSRKTLSAPVPPDRCYEWSPTICVYEEHARVADTAAARVLTAVRAAESAGYPALVPERIEASSYNYVPSDPRTRSFFLDPSDMDSPHWLQEVVMQDLLIPRCAVMSSEQGPPTQYFEDLARVISTWSWIAGLDDPSGSFSSRNEILSPAEVAGILDRWDACDLGSDDA